MNQSQYIVNSIIKAVKILQCFSFAKPELFPVDICKKLGFDKNTVHRYLKTLESVKLVHYDPDSRKYSMGIKAFEMGAVFYQGLGFRKKALPLLEDLMRRSKETIYLSVLDGNEIVVIEKVEPIDGISIRARVGRRSHLHTSAAGKIFLAFQPEKKREKILQDLKLHKLTSHTVTDVNTLNHILAKVRVDGYAFDRQESQEGVVCVSSPVKNFENRIVAALSISGPTNQMTDERIQNELLGLLLATSDDISWRLGYGEMAKQWAMAGSR